MSSFLFHFSGKEKESESWGDQYKKNKKTREYYNKLME